MIIDDFVEKLKENEYDWFLVATKMGQDIFGGNNKTNKNT